MTEKGERNKEKGIYSLVKGKEQNALGVEYGAMDYLQIGNKTMGAVDCLLSLISKSIVLMLDTCVLCL